MKKYKIIKDNLGKYAIQKKKSFMGVVTYETLKVKKSKESALKYIQKLKSEDGYFNKKRKVLDESETTISELLKHIVVNFIFGLTGGVVGGFITLFVIETNFFNGFLFFIFFLIHKQFESKILNRNKYVSKLGKNYIYPIPAALGFVLGVYLSTII